MGSRLENCPNEIIEAISQLLELEDIRNLRLSSKSLSQKTLHGRFRYFCHSKHLDIRDEALRGFIGVFQSQADLPPVKELYLFGLVWKQDQPHHDPEEESSLLVEAFNEIAKRSTDGCLKSLTLRLAVIRNDTPERVVSIAPRGTTIPKSVWSCATETWNTTLRALAASHLRVESINGFNEADMVRCSIPCDWLGVDYCYGLGLAESLKPLKSLSLSISDKIFNLKKESNIAFSVGEDSDDSEYGSTRDYRAEAAEEENFTGIAKLLRLCPHLEYLDLHYFHMYNRKINVHTEFDSERILRNVVELDKLPRLMECKLRGITANGEDLLRFLTRTRPCHLSLETIHLSRGTFGPIIEYCRSEEADMKELLLDSLYEPAESGRNNIIHFTGLQGSLRAGPGASEKILRDRDTMRQSIPFFSSRPAFVTAPWKSARTTRQRLEYG
ncbi:hypothetical protein BGZ63DRAFT_358404 [Mariannaea sp. PMI_226]|nr:hypothetical protein BGZ63DRAFT_358404 [Mariannaea sp. PMI_226]